MSEHDHTDFVPPAITGPGWYRDPAPEAPVYGRRYWDGEQWTDQVSPQAVRPVTGAVSAPMPPAAPAAPAPTAAGASVGGPASSAVLLTLPPPTGAPAFSANTPAPGWPPPYAPAPPPPAPWSPRPGPLQPGPSARPSNSGSSVPRWLFVVIALAVIGAIVAVLLIARGGDDGNESAGHPVTGPGLPSVIGYVNPEVSADQIGTMMDAVLKQVDAAGLHYSVNSNPMGHDLELTPNGTPSSDPAGDAAKGAQLLRATPNVLGVKIPTSTTAPYCGTVETPEMSGSQKSLVGALYRLHLAEQSLDYYLRAHPGRVSLNDVRLQIFMDEDFRDALSTIHLGGDAARDVQQVLSVRAQYDATLASAASAISTGDTAGFDRYLDQAEGERGLSGATLDALRADVGFPRNTCGFLSP